MSSALTPGGTAVVLVSWVPATGRRQAATTAVARRRAVDADGLLVLTGMAAAFVRELVEAGFAEVDVA